MDENKNAISNIQNYHKVRVIKDIIQGMASYADDMLSEIEYARDEEELFPDSNVEKMIETIVKDIEILKSYF